jgi:hypothetical protein
MSDNSTSCVGCKFLYGDGTGYSNYTWMETYARCALHLNPALEDNCEKPFNWPPDSPTDDQWGPTMSWRCDRYAHGSFITLDPDREGHPRDMSDDDEQIRAICEADQFPEGRHER